MHHVLRPATVAAGGIKALLLLPHLRSPGCPLGTSAGTSPGYPGAHKGSLTTDPLIVREGVDVDPS